MKIASHTMRWIQTSYILGTALCAVVLFMTFLSRPAYGKLVQMNNADLSEVCGTGGIDIAIKNFQIFQFINKFQYIGSDNGAIEFDNFMISAPGGGPYRLNYDMGATTKTGMIFTDVGTLQVAPTYTQYNWSPPATLTAEDRVIMGINAPWWEQNINYFVGNFLFSDPSSTVISTPVDLGELNFGPVELTSFKWYLSTHPYAYSSGIDWEHDFQVTIPDAEYVYQITSNPAVFKSLYLNNIYVGKDFASYTGDNPANPSTWAPVADPTQSSYNWGQFQVGDMFGDMSTNTPSNPATLDVGEVSISGSTYGMINFGLPLQGSMRIQDVNFGGTDFGPIAIDGIHAYRLNVQLIP